MIEKNIIMIRSPKELIKLSKIGYGWDRVKFSEYKTLDSLLNEGFEGINVGRKTNQIKSYYNLKKGDLVIVPVSRAIALAEVEGYKLYVEGIRNGENQVGVKFLKNENGDVAFIPRDSLSTALQSRLKLRMAIANFGDFKDELSRLLDSTKNGEIHTWKTEVERKEALAEKTFKTNLLKRIQQGKEIGLSAGGYGLEKLVRDLLQTQGYEANIQAKNQSSDISDIDIIAKRINLLTSKVEVLFIQVKHHKGTTNSRGIEQLKAYPVSDDIDFYSKILVTTGKINENVKIKADKDNIIILDGGQFVEWLYENIELLSASTKAALGIISIPSLV